MNPELLSQITLICPRCRRPDLPELADPILELRQVKETRGRFILNGTLVCSNPHCGAQYPILHGVPCILRNDEVMARIVAQSSQPAFSTEQLPPKDVLLAAYLDASYSSHCIPPRVFPDSLSNACYLQALRDRIPTPSLSEEIAVDLGCSVGWFAFELASHYRAVIGMDAKFSHLAAAAALQRGEEITFQRPVRSLASEVVKLSRSAASNLCFILADALDPPFRADSIGFASALNLIDSISDPLILLGQMDAMLQHGGKLLLASPFTWNREICPDSHWLEDPETPPLKMLRELLQGVRVPENGFDYHIAQEALQIPWLLPVSDQQWTLFKTQIMLAVKR